MRKLTLAALVWLALVVQISNGGGPADKEGYGFQFLHGEKVNPKKYLQTHPCVSGRWQFQSETDTHWIGDLHYPTGNVPPAYPTKDEAAFLVRGVKIEKQKGLPIDLKTWQGQVILLQADATVRFGTAKSLEQSFRLVGYEPAKDKGTPFLFQQHADLAYGEGK
jgi:hypothetical protein